jgi:glycosyltransferase involved in cell wall biosynthesis
MRYLFICRSLPAHRVGGMEAVVWDLARALAKRGHSVQILTTQCEALGDVVTIDTVKIRTIAARSGKYSKTWWRETERLVRTEYFNKVDVIISAGIGAYRVAQKQHRNAGFVLIMQSHGTAWGELVSKLSVAKPLSWLKAVKNLIGLFSEPTMRKFDHIVPIGQAVEQSLRGRPMRYCIGKTPITLINNGIDDEAFKFNAVHRESVREKLGIPRDAKVLITASRLHVQKGIHIGLMGLKKAKSQIGELYFVIVGEGPAAPELQELSRKLDLVPYVRFTGGVHRDELASFLSAGDVFIFTTLRQEGLPLGPLEASACGLPVIMSAHLEIPGLPARLVDPQNIVEVGLTIVEVCNELNKNRFSKLPRQYVIDHSVEMYERLSDELSRDRHSNHRV